VGAYTGMEESIPVVQIDKDTLFSTFGALLCFAVMLLLEVALG
jgi:hypothetical protein